MMYPFLNTETAKQIRIFQVPRHIFLLVNEETQTNKHESNRPNKKSTSRANKQPVCLSTNQPTNQPLAFIGIIRARICMQYREMKTEIA